MKILVIGGTGFIGANLVCELTKTDEVFIFARGETQFDFPAQVKFIQGDILDEGVLDKAIKGMDIVYHLAAAKSEMLPYEILYEVNVEGTRNVLEACFKNHIKQLVYLSTIGVLGPSTKNKTLSELSPYNPKTKYEKTKCIAEKIVLDYGKAHALPITVIRPTMVYGPDFDEWLRVFKLVKKRIPIIGSGLNHWHLVYVKDVVQALCLVKNNKRAFGQIYNIADAKAHIYKDVYKIALTCLGEKEVTVHLPIWLAKVIAFGFEIYGNLTKSKPLLNRAIIERLIRERNVNTLKAQKELGFSPKYTLQEGIKETVKFFKAKKLL